jgi:4-carboxymuconolactone decarboxylase
LGPAPFKAGYSLFHKINGIEDAANYQLKKEGKMGQEPSAAQQTLKDFAPKLAELTDSVLFGDVWERPGLSKRDRSLVTVAALVALYRPEQLRFHLNKAMDNGLSKDELIETITHLAFYSGWPAAMSAIMIMKEVVATRETQPKEAR